MPMSYEEAINEATNEITSELKDGLLISESNPFTTLDLIDQEITTTVTELGVLVRNGVDTASEPCSRLLDKVQYLEGLKLKVLESGVTELVGEL